MKVATHLVFAECCWFATTAVADVHYETPAVLVAAITSVLPDADYPKSWLGYQLGSVSEDLRRLFGHRSFLHSFIALLLVTVIFGLPLWWIFGRLSPMLAVFVGYGSHIFADMMTLGGVQLFWPSRAIAVFPGRDEYRVVSGGNSERVFVALALIFALLFYPVSRVGTCAGPPAKEVRGGGPEPLRRRFWRALAGSDALQPGDGGPVQRAVRARSRAPTGRLGAAGLV